MEITVVKEFTFDAAHFLPNHPGKCKNMHGHTYKLQIGLKGKIYPDTGMVLDFGHIKTYVQDFIIDIMDHKLLNDITPGNNFPTEQPTAERMVVWIVQVLKGLFPIANTEKLSFVRLYETPTSWAEWREENAAS